MLLIMHVDFCSFESPVVEPFGVGNRKVHTAMTHRSTKVIVPVGPMQTISLIEIHGVGHVGQVVPGTRHRRGFELNPDFEIASDGGRARGACGDDE